MKSKIVTLFIHGTLPPTAAMNIPLVQSFFFCPQGLTRASDLDKKYHLATVAQLLCNNDEFDTDSFYLFGWSGKLRFAARKQAAQELYNHIETLKNTYASAGFIPYFRVITHSHGGNVALYLKEVADEQKKSIADGGAHLIDELILLACPVQIETAPHAHDPLFKNVFSIHSHRDILQVLDPQGLHHFLESLKRLGLEFTLSHLKQLGPLFSSRHFKPAPHVTQLNVKYPHRELLHLEFLLPTVISELPSLVQLMKATKLSNPQDELMHILKTNS